MRVFDSKTNQFIDISTDEYEKRIAARKAPSPEKLVTDAALDANTPGEKLASAKALQDLVAESDMPALFDQVTKNPQLMAKISGGQLEMLSNYAVNIKKEDLPKDMSASQLESNQAKITGEMAIRTLEDLYFFNERGPLAYTQKGDQFRKSGHIENFQAKNQPDYNPELKTYLSQLGSMGARLAKMGGDTGNIAIQEQATALKGLMGGGDMTLTEALQVDAATRKKFGLPERDIKAELIEQGKTSTTTGDGKTINYPELYSGKKFVPQMSQQTEIMKTLTPQSSAQPSAPSSTTDVPFKELSGALALFQKNPFVAATTGAVGQAVDDASFAAQQINKPFAEMSQEEKGRLQKLNSPGYFTEPLKTAAGFGIAKLGQNALASLLSPISTIKKLSTGGITDVLGMGPNLSQVPATINATGIPQSMARDMSSQATTETYGAWNKAVNTAKDIYSNKSQLPVSDAVTKAAGIGARAWKSGGEDLASKVAAPAMESERKALTSLVKESNPLFKSLYKLAEKEMKLKGGLEKNKNIVLGLFKTLGMIGGGIWATKEITNSLSGKGE